MNTVNIIDLSLIIIVLSSIWYLYFWLYKDYTIDYFRQDLFELRDELFYEAAGGLIDFNHPAYCLLRRTMNGNIRFSHRMSILNLIILSIVLRGYSSKEERNSFENRMEKALAGLPEETKYKLAGYRKRLQKIYLNHLIRESPFAFAFILLLLAITIIPFFLLLIFRNSVFSIVQSIVHQELDSIESTALAAGKLGSHS